MLLALRISSDGCTWEVWRALKKLELLSCSPNFPRASITRYTHAKHEPVLKYKAETALFSFLFGASVRARLSLLTSQVAHKSGAVSHG